ncbi:MAG TPA: hypothetical protein VFA29_13240 [Candidatus Baltobacteraceae bacterium]|nr:hypothetical protein [Candidatus Baltobacteraceae bacterium]
MSRLGILPLCAVFALSGCSASSLAPSNGSLAQVAAKQLGQAPRQNCIASILEFLSDNSKGEVYVYNNGSSSACLTITHVVPLGMDVGNTVALGPSVLFVASALTHKIYAYKPPYTAVSQTITDPAGQPFDVTLCKGYIAAPHRLSNTISIFSYAGALLRVLSAPAGTNENFATCDGSANLYTDGTAGASTVVTEFAGGKGAPIVLNAVGAAVAKPGGLEWENGALWVDDQTGLDISIWPPPFTSSSATIHLSGAADPIKFEVSPSDAVILSADAGLDRGIFYNLAGSPIGVLNPFVAGGSLVGANFNKDDP